jgi:hypothetical protein
LRDLHKKGNGIQMLNNFQRKQCLIPIPAYQIKQFNFRVAVAKIGIIKIMIKIVKNLCTGMAPKFVQR